ncbi:MAG: adenylate/guanylate cyclase domain-containing protein, partial [Planctomycetota bacterium]
MAHRELEQKALIHDTLDKYKELTLLYDIADKIAVCLELKDIARVAIDEAKRLIKNAQNASVMLLKNGTLEIVAASGIEYTQKIRLKPGEGIAGIVLSTGKAEIVNDVARDTRFAQGNYRVSSLLCAPLKVKDRVIGVCNISNNSPVVYTAGEMKLLCILASQVASAIENALLHENRLREEHAKAYLQRYVAPQIVNNIFGDDKECISLDPVKKDIAILFSDIRGFSSTCEKLMPEETVAYLNEYFTQMVEIIFNHNGTVNKFVGDMIVAIFGAPTRCDDNKKQAVKTAIMMQRRLSEIKNKWIRDNFNTGIGISAGEVVVGNIGSPQHMDYTAIGDEVNIAERLEALAQGKQILVDRNVYEATKDAFEFKDMGSFTVKGKKKKVDVF